MKSLLYNIILVSNGTNAIFGAQHISKFGIHVLFVVIIDFSALQFQYRNLSLFKNEKFPFTSSKIRNYNKKVNIALKTVLCIMKQNQTT